MILPMMLINAYGAESTIETVISEENVNSDLDNSNSQDLIFPMPEDDGRDIFDLFDGELIKNENEIKILNYMFVTFVVVIVIRLILLIAGIL